MTPQEAREIIIQERDSLKANPMVKIEDCLYEAFDMAIKALEQARPNGKWKRISPAGIYECTNCNQVIMTSDIDCYKYCHGCGVRMEGKNERTVARVKRNYY